MVTHSDYTFYFDESFHDQKIVIENDGRINTMVDGALDTYVGLFWGCKDEEHGKNVDALLEFENKWKRTFNMCNEIELKTSSISRKYFKRGIQSFNKNTLNFYTDLFSLVCDIRPIIQVELISKMEFLIRHAFRGITFRSPFVDEDAFFYVLTKFLITYGDGGLTAALYNVNSRASADNLKRKIIHTLDNVLKAIKNIRRKEVEYSSLLGFRQALIESRMDIKIKTQYDFQYYPNFDGLCNLLEEIEIDPQDVRLFIDYDEKTYSQAKSYPFKEIEKVDSKEVVQIRLSDWLSGFIGRMIYAISNDPEMAEDKITDIKKLTENDLETKRIIGPKWFEISEEGFNLYKLIFKALVENQQHYWSVMTLAYGDEASLYTSLIQYIGLYDDYRSYKNVDSNAHREKYNGYCIQKIQDKYQRHNRYV